MTWLHQIFVVLEKRDTSIVQILDQSEEPTLDPELQFRPWICYFLTKVNTSIEVITWFLFCSGISIVEGHQADTLKMLWYCKTVPTDPLLITSWEAMYCSKICLLSKTMLCHGSSWNGDCSWQMTTTLGFILIQISTMLEERFDSGIISGTFL